MTVREYIGARYVPLFMGEWDNSVSYEPLSIVTNEGNSYTSRQHVPIGVDISNETYWALTGNYNAQIEQYIQTVTQFDNRIDNLEDKFDENGNTSNIADDAVTTDKISDDAVTSDKIADDAVTSDKIADEFKNGIENEFDRQKTIMALKTPVFTPYTRYVFENTGNQYYGMQVSTMDEDEQYFYLITPFQSSDQSTTKTSCLRVIDPQSGSMVTSKTLDVGHGRSLTCKGDLLLTSNQYAETNNEWVVIDISNKTNPILVSRGSFNGRHIFWTDEGAACYTGANTIKFFDVTYNAQGYPTAFTENGEFITFASGIRGEEQSFQYWNGFIIMASSLPEQITIIDAKTGEIIAQNTLKINYSFLRTNEIESAFIVNNHFYFSNNGTAAYLPDGTKMYEASFFRYDLFDPKGEFFDYWRATSYQSTKGGGLYVSGEKPSASSVSCDGSQTYPFWFVEDCFTSWVAQYRDFYNNIKLDNAFGITVDNAAHNYPYVVHLVDYYGTFAGVSPNVTTVPCVIARYSGFTMNRIKCDGATNSSWFDGINAKSGMLVYRSNARLTDTCQFGNDVTYQLVVHDFSQVSSWLPLSGITANFNSVIKAVSVADTHPSTGAVITAW